MLDEAGVKQLENRCWSHKSSTRAAHEQHTSSVRTFRSLAPMPPHPFRFYTPRKRNPRRRQTSPRRMARFRVATTHLRGFLEGLAAGWTAGERTDPSGHASSNTGRLQSAGSHEERHHLCVGMRPYNPVRKGTTKGDVS